MALSWVGVAGAATGPYVAPSKLAGKVMRGASSAALYSAFNASTKTCWVSGVGFVPEVAVGALLCGKQFGDTGVGAVNELVVGSCSTRAAVQRSICCFPGGLDRGSNECVIVRVRVVLSGLYGLEVFRGCVVGEVCVHALALSSMGFAPPVASASPERESVRINGPGDSYAIASWDWAAHNHMDNVEIYVEDTACNGLPAYAYFRVDADRDFSTTHRGDRECQGGGTNYSGLDVGPEAGNEIYSVQFVLCEDEATIARPVCEQTESIRNPARTSDPGDGDKGKCATPTHADWFPGPSILRAIAGVASTSISWPAPAVLPRAGMSK